MLCVTLDFTPSISIHTTVAHNVLRAPALNYVLTFGIIPPSKFCLIISGGVLLFTSP